MIENTAKNCETSPRRLRAAPRTSGDDHERAEAEVDGDGVPAREGGHHGLLEEHHGELLVREGQGPPVLYTLYPVKMCLCQIYVVSKCVFKTF